MLRGEVDISNRSCVRERRGLQTSERNRMAATEATNQESRRLELKSDTSQDSSEEKVQWKRDFLKQAVANAGEQGGNEKPRKERTRKAAQSEQRRRIEIRER